jgi:SAM-dependent methyltransferase
MTSDPYAALARVQDAFDDRFGAFAGRVRPRLEALLGEAAPPGRRAGAGSFLDLGCGTGRLLEGLRARHPGWRLAGVDASPAMLEAARRRLAGARVELIEARIEELPAGSPFDAVGCFHDTLNHLPGAGALGRVFGAVARRLATGGLFVFDVNNAEGFRAWWRGGRTVAGPGFAIRFEATFDAAAGLGRGRAIVESRGGAGSDGVTEVRERLFTPREIEAALAAAGLEAVATEPWAPFDDGVPGKTWYVAGPATS